jgi:hypothetical protein
MTDLLFDGANNIAGNFLIRFVPVAGVSSLPLPAPFGPTAGVLPAGPTFLPNFRWFTAYGTDQTKDVIEDESDTDSGPLWDVSIEFYLPGDSAARRLNLAEMARHRFLVAVEDNMGVKRLFGTLTEPLRFSYKFQVPKQIGDRRGAFITFRGTLTRVAPTFTG